MARIGITDVALRDAHQSLFATRMLTSDMIPVSGLLDRVGYWSLETWGGATYDACIRFLNEDPWERLRQLKAEMPQTRQQMLLRGQNLLGYRHYADDVVDAFVLRAAHHGIDVFRIFDALNDPRNFQTSIRAVRKAGRHAQATISYATSPVHTRDSYIALARELQSMGADSICIKDMAGLLKPYDAAELVRGLKENVGLPVHVHTHSTTGMSVATLLKAVEAGADCLDTAISSMAMGTSHSPTETLVEILRDTEYDTGLDIKLLLEIAGCFRHLRQKYRKYESSFLGADTRILTAQVPGGMLSNLEHQLREQNAIGKLDSVLSEVAHVQKDFGYPPLVTPTSQIVGTQALFNVLFGRYERLTAESRDLLAGRYGRTPGEADPKLVRKALDELKLDVPVTGRPADAIPNELGRLEEELKARLGVSHVPVEDVLTYAMFPQVALQFFAKRHKGPVVMEAEPEARAPAAAKPQANGRFLVTVDGKEYMVKSGPADGGGRAIEVDGIQYGIMVRAIADTADVPAASSAEPGETIVAPMPGDIIKLLYEEGEKVVAGATVLIMEAMKMQLEVKARRSGIITFQVNAGASVKADQPLAVVQ